MSERLTMTVSEVAEELNISRPLAYNLAASNRLPADFGFMLVHPVATVAPTKLEDYKVHLDPPGISGSLVEGRINFDAFVLDNKAEALYYQAQA